MGLSRLGGPFFVLWDEHVSIRSDKEIDGYRLFIGCEKKM